MRPPPTASTSEKIVETPGGRALYPPNDIYITPNDRLRMAPQTVGGLHADATDPNAFGVPNQKQCTQQEIDTLDLYHDIYRVLPVGFFAPGTTTEYHLEAPARDRSTWPRILGTSLLDNPRRFTTKP